MNAEPGSLYAVGDLPVDDSILDNIKSEEDQVDPSDITTPCQVKYNYKSTLACNPVFTCIYVDLSFQSLKPDLFLYFLAGLRSAKFY